MLKMIIAEDEIIVRDGLVNNINWGKFGIEVIAEAADGQEALDLCMRLQTDILLTDIRMPIMDGLEVALKLKALESRVRVLIISGVMDFNYAKTALDVNVEGYILKPVQMDELDEMIYKVVNKINMDKNIQKEMTRLKQQLHEHFPTIREKFLRNFISRFFSNEREIQNKMQFFNIPLQVNESLLVSVLQMDDYGQMAENRSEEDLQLLSFSVTNIIEEIVVNYQAGVSFCVNENEFVVIFNQKVQNNGKYNEICEEIVSCLRKFLKISVSIGIGRSVSRFLSIKSSYQDACSALKYKFYTGKNSILNINDINSINDTLMDHIDSSVFYDHESQLMNSIKIGDSDGVAKILSSMFDQLRQMSVDYIHIVCVELVCMVSRTVQSMGENIDNIAGKRTTIFESIYKRENTFDLKNYVSGLFLNVAQYLSTKYNQKNASVIIRIIEIIEQRYMEDIGVVTISEEIYLTPNYISGIFKQKTGKTITEYITMVRMEEAKNLLKTTNLKILEVSEKVGYESPHYFSTVFKKYTGIHPQKYRS